MKTEEDFVKEYIRQTSQWQMVSYDDFNKIATFERTRVEADGAVFIDRRYCQDVTAVLEQNARDRANNAGKKWGDGQVVARTPLVIFDEKLKEATAAGDKQYIKKVLNDSDYRKLRTFEGRL